jgi:hypothetical protein
LFLGVGWRSHCSWKDDKEAEEEEEEEEEEEDGREK